MLLQKHLELLTAYVDGELTPRQREQAEVLLQQSPTARQLLQDLERDSKQLAALPRHLPPRPMVQEVLKKTAQVPAPVRATPSTLAPTPAGLPSWLGLALAACVLAGVTLASYWFLADHSAPQDKGSLAQEIEPPDSLPPESVSPPHLKNVEPSPPRFQFALSDLPRKAQVRSQLQKELAKETSAEITLSTHDAGKTLQNLQTVLKKHGINVLPNAQVAQQIKQGMKVLLFVEDLSPADVAGIMLGLAKEQKASSPLAEAVALNSFSKDRRGELADMLGIGLDELEPAVKSKDLLPVDGSISDVPVVDDKKKTNPGDPKNPPPAPKSSKLAIVMAYEHGKTIAPPTTAVQDFVKAHLKSKRPDNTIQLVIMLNTAPV